MKFVLYGILPVISGLLHPLAAQADDSSKIEEIIVKGKTSTAMPSLPDLNKKLSKVAGGTNLIDLNSFSNSTATLNDVMGKEPGIIMQEFFGGNDQPRLNIRGSGIQDNPVNRGINLLYDGLLVNQADGSFIIGLLAPEQTRFMTVYRGANALQYGGTSLGGAINLISRTGRNSDNFIRLQAGSHKFYNGSFGIGNKSEKWDYFIGAGYSSSDGYRKNSKGERFNVTGNFGFEVAENISNRTFVHYVNNDFAIPFVVHKQTALDHPQAVIGEGYSDFPQPATLPMPAVMHPRFGWKARGGWDGIFDVMKRKPHRTTEQFRLANKTHIETENMSHDLGISYAWTDDIFTDPLSHAVVDAGDFAVNYALNTQAQFLTSEDHISFNAVFNTGNMPTEFWVNNPLDGTKLYKYADFEMSANSVVLSLEYSGKVTQEIEVVTALQWLKSKRNLSGIASTPPSPGHFDKVKVNLAQDLTFDEWNPKIGVIYHASDMVRFYSNFSRSSEAPTFNHLVSRTVSPLIMPGAVIAPPAVPPFADVEIGSGAILKNLKMQTAWTFEIGTQGDLEDVSWQASYYYSKVKNELITLVKGFAVNAETLNYADDTLHQGIEFGLDYRFLKNIASQNDSLSANIIYNYSRFTFDGGIYAGKKIAGIPEHVIFAELNYNYNDQFIFAPNIKWQPNDTYVDHSNTQVQDSHFLLGLKLSYKTEDQLNFYADFKNITDKTYQSSYVIRGVSAVNQPTFLPADGFNFSVGVSYAW